MANSEIIDKDFDVNSEKYFNEKLNYWLNQLTPRDINLIMIECFGITKIPSKHVPTIHPWDRIDSSYGRSARFDQKIDYEKDLCIIFELKLNTEATIGQLKKYLEYIQNKRYTDGCVILLSRNELAYTKVGYDRLISTYPNLKFTTWKTFEDRLNFLIKRKVFESSLSETEDFIHLLSFLTDQKKRSERLLIQQPPPSINIVEHLKQLILARPPKRKGAYLDFRRREDFWDQIISDIVKGAFHKSFCTFRFDFYEYMIRWFYHKKRVYLDIYEDKNYEYYYNYFITTIYPNRKGLQATDTLDIYERYLLIRKDEVLITDKYQIFYRKNGKLWYLYVIDKTERSNMISYIKCYDLSF